LNFAVNIKGMEIIKKAQAGSFESCDILLLAEPQTEGKGITLELESNVDYQFGDSIKDVILNGLKELDVKEIHLVAKDKGAIEPVIKARLETVVLRAAGKQKGTI